MDSGRADRLRAGEVAAIGKIMSDSTKLKLSERLGVTDIVQREGWAAVPARQCGLLVKEAIRMAEEQLKR